MLLYINLHNYQYRNGSVFWKLFLKMEALDISESLVTIYMHGTITRNPPPQQKLILPKRITVLIQKSE
jgi:hypothetical protein